MKHRAVRHEAPAPAPAEPGRHEMHALLHKPLPAAPAGWTGSALGVVVRLHADGRYAVMPQTGGEPWHCTRAASCLLQPALGDTVLVAGPQREQVYLIAVITQADPARAALVVDGDLTLHAKNGGIALQAGTRLELASPSLNLHAQHAQLEVGEMDYRGAEVRVTTLVARFVGRTLETVLDRLSVLTRSSFRLTEEVEQVRAGQIDMQATETMRLHAKNTLVSSKALIKVDAEQIHMG
jgi:3-dehydroquinate synthase class II